MGQLLAGATRTHARSTAREFAEEIPHAIEEAGLRFGGLTLGVILRSRSDSGCGNCLRGGGVYVPVKNNRGAQARFAHQEDGFGARVGRRGGRIRIKTEWRHEDGIDGLFGGSRLRRIICLHSLRLLRTVKGADFI
jgi:hypothetical protein